MPAIPTHGTATVDEAWDGPGNEARLKLDQDYEFYRRAYAWRDPDGDPSTKAAYRFIHHEVDGDGNPGAANLRGCSTGIAILNGARGGTTIPDYDVEGVWRHFARHLRDADREPPELQRASPVSLVERRSFRADTLQVQGDEQRTIIGYAAVFDHHSEKLGGFREIIRRGAFKKTLQEADVRALLEHDPRWLLGNTRSKTLRLAEDDRGLRVEIDPPDTLAGRDAVESLKRGDLGAMSFGFRTIRDKWETYEGKPLRVLEEVQLFDVSLVAFPAYPDTSVALRSGYSAGIFSEPGRSHSDADGADATDESSRAGRTRERMRRMRRWLDAAQNE